MINNIPISIICIYIPGFNYLSETQQMILMSQDAHKQKIQSQIDKYNNLMLNNFRETPEIWSNYLYDLMLKQYYSLFPNQWHIDHLKDISDTDFQDIKQAIKQRVDNNFDSVKQHVEYHLNRVLLFNVNEKSLQNFSQQLLQYECWYKSALSEYRNHLQEQFTLQVNLLENYIKNNWKYSSNYFASDANKTIFEQGLSHLFQYADKSQAGQVLKNIADAHNFFQAVGMTSQSGHDGHTYLDLFNYIRNQESVAETKRIISTLALPLRSLYEEYKAIAEYEQNELRIILRALFPIVIIGLVVALFCVLMTPVGLPEIVAFLLLIPLIYIGCALSSGIINLRNTLYNFFRVLWYGDIYKTPEFQVENNQRMLSAFGSPDAAIAVKDLYVTLLKECDQKELNFAHKDKPGQPGLLTQDEIDKQRKDNLVRQLALRLEWYDIYDYYGKSNVGVDQLSQMVAMRINQEIQPIINKLRDDGRDYFNLLINEIAQDVQSRSARAESIPYNYYSTFNPCCLKTNQQGIAKTQHSYGFFQEISSKLNPPNPVLTGQELRVYPPLPSIASIV